MMAHAQNRHSFNLRFTTLILPLWLSTAFSAARTVRIDDAESAWTFTGSWNTINPATPCAGCWAHPDASKINMQTWHDGGVAGIAGGRIEYFGSTISVYGVLTELKSANIRFQLDDNAAVVYQGQDTVDYVYDVLFYQSPSSGSNAQHTLSFSLETSSFSGFTALMDYAVINIVDEVVTTSETVKVTETQTNEPVTRTSSTTTATTTTTASQTPPSLSISSTLQTTPKGSSSASRESTSSSSTSGLPTTSSGLPSISTDTPSPKHIESDANDDSDAGPPIGAIAGGAAGAVVLILLVITMLLCLRRKRQRQRQDSMDRALSPSILAMSHPGDRYSDHPQPTPHPEMGVASSPFYRTAPVMRWSSISKGGHVQMPHSSRDGESSYPSRSRNDSYPAAPESVVTSTSNATSGDTGGSSSRYDLEMRVRELEERLAVVDPDLRGPPPSY